MGGKRFDPVRGTQDSRCDIFPERRVGDMAVKDVMDRDRVGRHRTAGIDQKCTAVLVDLPSSVCPLGDILPADLADVVRSVAAGLEVDDADGGIAHVEVLTRRS